MDSLLCLVDMESTLKAVDVALLVLFIAALAILALAFLRGLFRGWKYGTYRLIAYGIMITVVLATLSAQANAVGNINLGGLKLSPISFTLTIDGTEHAIYSEWTTIQTTLEDVFTQILEAVGANGSANGVLAYASFLASSFIKLALIFLWGILLSTFGLLLVMLLWHIIFKRFTPKDRRKIKKLRIVSAFEELLIGAACLGMILSPFTSIANSLSCSFKVEDERAKENETVSMITDILGVYQESAFAKTFFSWNSMDGSTTFDQQLISFLIQTDVGDVKTDLLSEISTIASVSSDAINAGLLNAFGSDGIRWYFLLSSSSIPGILYSLSKTTLITSALPFAVSLAVNFKQVKELLGEQTCEWLSSDNVNWAETVQSMSRIYQNILDSGIIDCVKDEASETPVFDWAKLKYVFSDKDSSGKERNAKEAIHSLAGEIEDSALFSHLMAGLLSELGKAEQEKEEKADLSILDFLPLKEDGSISYEKLVEANYANEFVLLYDSIYSINETAPEVVDQVFGLVSDPPTEENQSERYRSILAEASRHADEFVEVVVGERDENGDPKEDSAPCLMDSYFVGNGLPSLLNFGEKAAGVALDMDDFTFAETKKKLNTLNDYKKEFGAALDTAAVFASSDAGYAFLKDGTGMVYDDDDNLVSIDPTLVKALQKSLDKADSSLLMCEALPQVADHYYGQFKDTLSEYGIEEVDFQCENLGHELSSLLDLIAYSGDLLLAVNRIGGDSAYATMSMLLEEEDDLLRILDIFASSKILNPEIDGKKNVNFASLLNHVFSSAGLTGWEIDGEALSDVKLESEYDAEGNLVTRNENGRILDVMMALAKDIPLTDLLALGTAGYAETVRILGQTDIESLFTKIGDSKVVSSIAGKALDDYFSPVLGYDEGGEITFSNVTDWKKEGQTVGKIVKLAMNGLDVSEFDLTKISPSLLEDLFSSLAGSQIFDKKGENGETSYKFPEYFSSKILGMLDDSSLPYFADEGKTISSSASLEEKKAACSLFVSNCLSLDSKEDWTANGGEVSLFGEAVRLIQGLGGFSGLSSFTRDKLPLIRDLLLDLASSACLGQVLLGNALEKSLSSLPSSSSFDPSLANPSVFFSSDFSSASSRVDEVNCLLDVLDSLFDRNYGLLDENGNLIDSRLSLSSLSVDHCLKPLLEGLSSSKVFSTSKEGKESLIQNVLETILLKSNLYGDDALGKDDVFSPSHASKVSVSSIVKGVADLDKEATKLCEILSSIQESGLLKGNSFDLSSLSSSSSAEVKDLLLKINSSELLYRCLPLQIEKAISSISLPDKFKADLSLCDPYVMENDDSSDFLPYEENEIECVVSLLGASSEFSDLDFTSVSSLTEADPSKLLSPLYASRIFNEKTDSSTGFTSAQSFLVDLLFEMGIDDDLIYSSSSPKDIAWGVSSARGKLEKLVEENLGKGENGNYSQYSLTAQKEETNRFYQVLGEGESSLSTFLANLSSHSLGDVLNGGNIDFKNLSDASLSALLKDLSHCALLSDLPINALAKYLSGSDIEVDGIDLGLANFYYPYEYDESGAKRSQADYSKGYGDNEIDLLVDLIGLIEDSEASLESTKVSDLDPYLLRQLMLELDDSLLFHLTGVNAHPSSSSSSITSDLTVFQQLMYLIYDKSGLAERSFDEYHDFSYLIEANGDASKAAELKVHARILSLEEGDWFEEIQAMTTDDAGESGLIQLALTSNLLTSDGSSVAMTSDLLKTLTPGKVSQLLVSLGKSKICGDSLAKTISLFLTSGESGASGSAGLGVEKFSTLLRSDGNKATFASSSAFLEQKIAYKTVSFSSSAYDSSSFLSVKGDLDGDGTYEKDLSAYVPSSFDSAAGIWTFDTSKIGCPFELTMSGSGSCSYSFDAARYYLPSESYAENSSTMEALELFLCSMYSPSGEYFSFEGKSSAIEEAIDNGIHLYGIVAILFDSEFYASSYFDADFTPVASSPSSGGFSASAVSLYQMLSYSPTVASFSAPVSLLDDVDEPVLSAAYGSSSAIPLSARLSSIEKLIGSSSDNYAESAFLEKALAGASLSQGVHATLEAAFSNSSFSDSAKTIAYRYAAPLLAAHRSFTGASEKEQGDYYEDFLLSLSLPYDYTVSDCEGKSEAHSSLSSQSVFAKPLLAGALNDRVEERLAYVSLSSHELSSAYPLSSPTKQPESSYPRIDSLSSADLSSLQGFDAYGYDPSSSYSYAPLDALLEQEAKSVRFEEMIMKGIQISSSGGVSLSSIALTSAQKEGLDELASSFDSLSDPSYVKLSYLADSYDYFVLKGSNLSSLGQDYFFHAANSTFALSATDFPSTFGDGVYQGSQMAFSFGNACKAVLVGA